MKIKNTSSAIIAMSICQFVLWGTIYFSFTLFIEPIHNHFDWSRFLIVSSFSIALCISGIFAIPVGKWVDRRGGFIPLTGGCALSSMLLFSLSSNTSAIAFVAIWIGLGVAMAAVLSQTAYTVFVQMGVEVGRKAILYCSLGTAVSASFFLPINFLLIDNIGWKSALRVLSLLNLLCAIIHFIYVPRSVPVFIETDSIKCNRRIHSLLINRSLLLIISIFASSSAIAAVLAVHLIPLLLWGEYSMSEAVFAAALVGPAQIVVRIFMIGKISRMISYYGLGILAMGFQLASLLIFVASLVFFFSFPLICIFSIFNGLSLGAGLLSRALITTEFFEIHEYGLIQGYIQTASMLARAVAPAIFVFVMSSMGTQVSLYLLLILAIISIFSILSLKGKFYKKTVFNFLKVRI